MNGGLLPKGFCHGCGLYLIRFRNLNHLRVGAVNDTSKPSSGAKREKAVNELNVANCLILNF